MKITVIPWVESESDWPPVNLADQTVVVIDVLRATSTIVTALAHGVSAVIPVLTPEEAFLRARPGDVLAGERGSQRLPGFDLGNSPREFTRQRVGGKRVILSTTNGTKTLLAARGAKRVLVGSLLNLKAVAQELSRGDGEIKLLCSGTRGRFSLEDTLCAGGIIDRLLGDGWGKAEPIVPEARVQIPPWVSLDDLAHAALFLYQREQSLSQTLALGVNGNDLKKLGLEEDVAYCAQEDIIDLCPEYRGGEVVISQRSGR